jgi:hypothetical protein
MAISRYRLNDNPVGTALKADQNAYYTFRTSTAHSGVAGVTTPIPKEGQRCRAVTGSSGTFTHDIELDVGFPLYTYAFLDFYFYNSSTANTDWRIYLLAGYNDFAAEATYQWAYIKQSTNEVFVAEYSGFGIFNETSLGADNIPRDKWSRIVVDIGIDYGDGFWGYMNKVSVFTGTNINGSVPDYSNTTNTGFTTSDFGVFIGQTGGEAVSQVGGFIDDVIFSDSVIVRKKPFVIG